MCASSTAAALRSRPSPESERFAPALRAAGLGVELRRDMPNVLWGKLLLNLFNPINGLGNQPIRAQLLQRDYRVVFAALIAEALAVLRAAGIPPLQVSARRLQLLPDILRLDDQFVRLAADMLKIKPVGQDLDVRRPAGRPRRPRSTTCAGRWCAWPPRSGFRCPLNRAMHGLVTAYPRRPGLERRAGCAPPSCRRPPPTRMAARRREDRPGHGPCEYPRQLRNKGDLAARASR